MFPGSDSYRRTTAKSLSFNVVSGVIVRLVSYFGYSGHQTKDSVLWAIIFGIAGIVLTFFLYRWRANGS